MTRFASTTLLLPVLGTLLLAVPASAESIQLSQQGRLADIDGVPLEGSHELAIGLYDDDAAGNELWSSSFSVDLVGGYYSVILGAEGTLDDYLFAEAGVWIQLTVDGEPLLPRQEIVEVPRAGWANTATHLEGGMVDAADIAVGGDLVIDSSGTWVGEPIDGTLGGLSCSDGEIAKWNSSSSQWVCGTDNGGSATDWNLLTNVPAGFADGLDSDALASLACSDGAIPSWNAAFGVWICGSDTDTDTLASLFCLDGAIPTWNTTFGAWVCGTDTDTDTLAALLCPDGATVQLSGGNWVCGTDSDTQLTESEVEGFVTNGAINLAGGSSMGGVALATMDDLSTGAVNWSSLSGVPTGFSDGVDDDNQLTSAQVLSYVTGTSINLATGTTLGGQAISTSPPTTSLPWSSITGIPADIADGDGILTEAQVEAYITNQAIALGPNSTMSGSVIATMADIGSGGVSWSQISGIPTDIADGDNDTITTTLDWNAITGVPTDLADGDDVLTEVEVETFVTNQAINIAAGSTIGGAPIATEGTLGDELFVGSVVPGTTYQSTDTPIVIPDSNPTGISSTFFVASSASIPIVKFTVDVDITHPDVGEISITLFSPEGSSILIYDGDDAGQADLDGNIDREIDMATGSIWDLYGEDTGGGTGIWRLEVVDGATGNAGTLNAWSLNINETWTGDMFVGSSITAEGDISTTGDVNIMMGADLVFTNTSGVETGRIDGETGVMTGNFASCPSDMVQVGESCIEMSPRGTDSWRDSSVFCANQGRRLCTSSEWYAACSINPSGLISMTGGWELTGDFAYQTSVALFGSSSCSSYTYGSWTSNYRYRCCMTP